MLVNSRCVDYFLENFKDLCLHKDAVLIKISFKFVDLFLCAVVLCIKKSSLLYEIIFPIIAIRISQRVVPLNLQGIILS